MSGDRPAAAGTGTLTAPATPPTPSRQRRPRALPVLTDERVRLGVPLLVLELLTLPVVVLTTHGTTRLVATAVALGVALLLVSVPVAGLRITAWGGTVVRWLARRSTLRRVARRAAAGGPVPEVALPVRVLQTGALAGPQASEVGVLWGPGGWTSALYVADDRPDALTRLLQLPEPSSPAVSLRSVLQQMSPGGPSSSARPAALPISAWVVLHVDPIRAVRTRDAVGALPALLRSEIRSLLDQTRPGTVGLVALDHSDLVDALAASAELPRGQAAATDAREGWNEWSAGRRCHRSFAVRPGRMPLTSAVEMLLDGVTLRPGTTVTVSVRHSRNGRAERYPVTARVSHPDAAAAAEVASRLRAVLRSEGAATRTLAGRQGPGLLETTLLAAR